MTCPSIIEDVEYLSAIDFVSSFWQIPPHEDSRKYAAFVFEGTCYVFNVVPFGLKISTSAFKIGLDKIFPFSFQKFLKIYVDDLIVKSKLKTLIT
jgi:Reverse transcriptase (RNA-dependent DNA polymerase)